MSWCDLLASVPTAGFKLDPYIASSDKLLDSWRPIIQPLAMEERPAYTFELFDPTSLTINTDQGFRYGVDHAKIHVRFNHRLRATPTSGGVPVLQMLSEAKPYSELMPEVLDRLIQATLLLPGASERRVHRVGMVCETTVSEGDLPPGISKLIQHLSSPWDSTLEQYNIQFTTSIYQDETWSDNCIYTLARGDDAESLAIVTLDWGRTFKEPRRISDDSLRTLTNRCREASFAYFEEVGEGSRFDAE